MSNGLIMRPIPLTAAQVTGGFSFAGDPNFPFANLADPQPKIVVRSSLISGAWNMVVNVDLLADTWVDTVALLYTDASHDSQWFVAGATSADGLAATDIPANYMFGSTPTAQYTPFGVLATTTDPTRHGLLTGAGRMVRYLRIFFADDAAVAGGYFRAGVVAVGARWQCANPMFNFELGSGRKVVDLSDKRALPGGEVGRWAKAKLPAFRATWSNMTDADLLTLWAILLDAGFTEPLLVVEDPDPTPGLNERIHYCTVDSLDYYQRTQADKSTIELKVTDWR